MSWLSNKPIPVNERLIVALDVPDIPQAKALVTLLGDSVIFYKIGLELFMSGDYFELIDWLNEQNKRIFVDLKFFDVPATVGRAVKQLSDKKVDFVTIHGNNAIMQAAAEQKGQLKVLAVTVLTSLDRGDLDDLGFKCDVEELVTSRAKRAIELGCDGVISSGLEAPGLRDSLGPNFLVVSPGIRPVDNKPNDDQKRVVSVEQAFYNGADHIVVGRPIRDARDPKQAALDIQKSIRHVFSENLSGDHND
ncbi:MAG: orotidine-5'-phosphate decarboxylase [Cycloclasticus pugetii]|uniref:orotidine-5'-phosphate decarboxylase n=1 Tax=Cycloclasticus pugetii TaxID=34068 RepID=UPI002409A55F|nr:orotidine-5'-phosphate decarboxylase [Cycloclasticus pugetii]MDF1828674.1 orotidine-5'-phosphate decarboxylase [Cycloclasticus pugetii]